MLTSIKGFYSEGQIILIEEPPMLTKSEVIITFLNSENVTSEKPQRKLGGLEGKVNIPDNFNEPLAEMKDFM